jgi:hypothetical protein
MTRSRAASGRVRQLALALALALAASIVTGSVVSANTRSWFVVTFVPEASDPGFCPFPTRMTEDGTFKVADSYDGSGILNRTIVTSFGQLTLTLWNPANGKTVVTHNESQVIIVDWLADGSRESIRRAGLTFAMTYPGAGAVFLNVGVLTHDYLTGETFLAGPHDIVFGDFDALCAALA